LARVPFFALDTNALIHALKGSGHVRQRLTAVDPGQIAIPAVVAYEVEYGTLKSANSELRRRELNRLLSVVEILPSTVRPRIILRESVSNWRRLGRRSALDFLIAGTVLAFGCTLVTNNTGEFRRVPGLRVEDWF
jgi:tRNA(fMet)-specific endonuclease VapC